MLSPDSITSQHILTPRRVAMMEYVGAYTRDSVQLDEIRDYSTDLLCRRLVAFLLTDTCVNGEKDVELAVPATWWQHFKRDTWIGRKIARCRPIRLKIMKQKVSFEHLRGYPEANSVAPPSMFGRPVIYETFNEFGWRDAES